MRTLYVNAMVYSPASVNATALLVDGPDIAWVGDDPADGFLDIDDTVDLDGALVTPGFVDAHVHATATGMVLTGLDLAGAGSLRAALDLVDRHARRVRGRPVLGSGWDETRWPEGRPPTRPELDRAGYGGLVYLARVDAHAAVASSALLAAVPGVALMAGYRPDGWLTGEAHHAARAVAFGSMSAGQVHDAQAAARRHAATLGVVCLHEMAGPEISGADDLAGLLTLATEEPGPEVIGYWAELGGIGTAQDLGAAGAGGDLFVDGSLGSHTAALHEPYADSPHTSGELRFAAAELATHISACRAAGLQAGFHAIGDAAVDLVLDAAELANAAGGGGAPVAAGHRIEHAELVTSPERLAASGLIASLQPAFDGTWGGAGRMYETRLGAERARRMNRFAQLAAAGVPLAFGSDSPVTPMDPWTAVRAASHPSDAAAAISPRAAFRAHTRGGWRAARADSDGSGMLTPGAPASFAVWHAGTLVVDAPDDRVSRWSTDPRAGVPALPDVGPGQALPTCMRTVVRGRTVFADG